MRHKTLTRVVVLAPALGLLLAACGGSTPAHKPSASAAPSATSSGSASAEIIANWREFFDPTTPVARRVQLLQNGQVFAQVIQAQAGSGLASSASAQVTKVTLVSPTRANVTYSILVGGTPALQNQSGVAVLQDGTWKVGDASFCGLLALENGGKTTGLPAACGNAG